LIKEIASGLLRMLYKLYFFFLKHRLIQKSSLKFTNLEDNILFLVQLTSLVSHLLVKRI